MNKSITYFLIALFFSCASNKIEDKVISKLKLDNESIEVYINLCKTFNDSRNDCYDLYLDLYNKGIPFVRLFEYETILKSFTNNNCKKSELDKDYISLISNKLNYINDERRYNYFQEYINNYLILPPAN
jgi:hypothetical protein